MDEETIKELEKSLRIKRNLEKETPSTEEVADLIATIIQVVKEAKEHLEKQARENKMEMDDSFHEAISNLEDMGREMEVKMMDMHSKMDKKMSDEMDDLVKKVYSEIRKVEKSIPTLNFEPIYGKIKEVESKIVPFELKAEDVRDSLEILRDNERLDKSAIKGIEAIEEKIKSIELRPSGVGGGSRGIQLYVDGVKEGQVNMVNLIAGTNVTLTYARASGRNDVTIDASGGGSMTVLAATGTINDSNMSFDFASAPTLILINGIAYRSTGGAITWSYAGTTATLSQPVGSGGDIYALG